MLPEGLISELLEYTSFVLIAASRAPDNKQPQLYINVCLVSLICAIRSPIAQELVVQNPQPAPYIYTQATRFFLVVVIVTRVTLEFL